MKSLTDHIGFDTDARRSCLNTTGKVRGIVKRSGVPEGLCLVNAMHITGGESDFGLWEQIFYAELDGRRRKRVLVEVIGK